VVSRRRTPGSWKKRPDIKAMQEANENSLVATMYLEGGRRFQPNLVPVSTWNAIKRLKAKGELEQVDDALGGYRLTEAGRQRARKHMGVAAQSARRAAP